MRKDDEEPVAKNQQMPVGIFEMASRSLSRAHPATQRTGNGHHQAHDPCLSGE